MFACAQRSLLGLVRSAKEIEHSRGVLARSGRSSRRSSTCARASTTNTSSSSNEACGSGCARSKRRGGPAQIAAAQDLEFGIESQGRVVQRLAAQDADGARDQKLPWRLR